MNDETAAMDPETDFDQEPSAEELAELALVENEGAELAEDTTDPDDEDGPGTPSGSTGPDIVIEGSGQLSLTVGGKRPTSSSVRLVGGSIGLEGSFQKGEVISLLVEARVSEIAFIDTVDDSGTVTATERRHKARIVGAVRD